MSGLATQKEPKARLVSIKRIFRILQTLVGPLPLLRHLQVPEDHYKQKTWLLLYHPKNERITPHGAEFIHVNRGHKDIASIVF